MSAEAPRISYVLPVHNEAAGLRVTVETTVTRLRDLGGGEVILVENGSSDTSPALVRALATELSTPRVAVVAAESSKGFGHAARAGLALTHGDLVVLTAADLPFGFSDLDAALALDPRPPLVLGSKTHPLSRNGTRGLRRVMSPAFRLLRGLVLGLWMGDTQGTLLVDGGLARALAPRLRRGDFLVSTELVARALADGVAFAEVPVDYSAPRAASTVSPLADSLGMARGLFAIRRDLRRRRPVDAVSTS